MDKQLITPTLFDSIKTTIEEARNKAKQSINNIMIEAYWRIGRLIVEDKQNGNEKASYGEGLIKELSLKLSEEYGKGFSKRNLHNMVKFYKTFSIVQTVSAQLSWSHYLLILKVEDDSARKWYIKECEASNWSVRALERQINSHYFERILLSKDKTSVEEEAKENTKELVYTAKEFVKDPYVLEFLNLSQNERLYESDLENALISDIQKFLLELGRGFAFVSRQKRVSLEDDHFYIDLVFYNYLLKCFVLIDLKAGKLTHQDVGQMDMYVKLFDDTQKAQDDNPTVGIILCSDKNETVVKYSNIDNKTIFASKYKLYLPSVEELKEELEKEKMLLESKEK